MGKGAPRGMHLAANPVMVEVMSGFLVSVPKLSHIVRETQFTVDLYYSISFQHVVIPNIFVLA